MINFYFSDEYVNHDTGSHPESIQRFKTVKQLLNNKYANNYDYYRAIYMMGKHNILENGFLILKEDKTLHSPVSVLNYEYYVEKESLALQLDVLKEDIQCIVGKDYIPFGQAQQPNLADYADGVDTLRFLESI